MAVATSSSSCCKITKPYAFTTSTPSQSPFKLKKFTATSANSTSIRCTIARDPVLPMEAKKESNPATWQRPDVLGRFGKFGGKYVPETLMCALSELESAFHKLANDQDFQVHTEGTFVISMLSLVLIDACVIAGGTIGDFERLCRQGVSALFC